MGSCSVNNALVSVLPQIVEGKIHGSEEVPGEAVSAIGADTTQDITVVRAVPSSDSESQGGETDAPGERKTGQYSIFCLGVHILSCDVLYVVVVV